MPRRKGQTGPKDPFEGLDEEYKDLISRLEDDKVRQKIAEVAMAQVDLMAAKEADTDFQSLREQTKDAGAIYRDGTKANKLKIAFAKQVLGDRGKAT
jgi:hypothetical protein